MLGHWGYRIPVLMSVLGACSVYDASLLSSSAVVNGGAAGAEAGTAGTAGSLAGGGSEDEAGAAGSSAGAGEAGGTVGGGGGTGGSGGSSAGAGGSVGGMGGSSAGQPSAGSGGAPVPLELELIDDMENGDTVIDATNGRGGDWYAAHDLTATGTQSPNPFGVTALAATDSRYPKSKFAAMTMGMGFTDWGENLGFNMKLLNGATHPPYNATAYCGVHFFGKVGAGASTKALFRVIDKYSHPDGGECGTGGKPCYQYFQKQLTFTTAWQEQSVLFTDLVNASWPPKLALDAVFSVEFGLTASAKFEIWVDDVAFLKKPASGVCPTKL